jgi:hypothetical protein
MSRRRGVLAGVCCAAVLLLWSCASIPIPGGEGRESLAWKVVIEKREPNLLIAADRTECEVSRDRFEKAEMGERTFCHWR